MGDQLDISTFRVAEGAKLDLGAWDTKATPGWDADDRSGAEARTVELNQRLEELQERLWAQGTDRLLVVLQAMDAGGKDGTIKRVFEHVNPSGVRVAAFKQPSASDLAHDYLWRVHAHVPAKGEIVIFNRSHYEDVLVVRVMELVEESRWKRRYRHIREFEQMLADEGTTIVKLFLHISRDEQRQRLQERLDNPEKHWKFNPGDLTHRERWDDYMQAFADALGETSTDDAPWYIIPADRKWFRNLAITEILVQTLERMEIDYPPPADGLDGIVIPD